MFQLLTGYRQPMKHWIVMNQWKYWIGNEPVEVLDNEQVSRSYLVKGVLTVILNKRLYLNVVLQVQKEPPMNFWTLV